MAEIKANSDRSETPFRCTECNRDIDNPSVCRFCHCILAIGVPVDHFQRLGLPRTFHIDLEALETKFLELTRQLHPDFYQDRAGHEQRLSLIHSSELNKAYSILKDLFERAEYLLSLEATDEVVKDRRTPPEILTEMLELREEFEMAKGKADDPATAEELRTMAQDLRKRRERFETKIKGLFTEFETKKQADEDTEAVLRSIRSDLTAAKYVLGLEDDLLELI